MTLEEILPHLKNGKKCCRGSWEYPQYIYIERNVLLIYMSKKYSPIAKLESADILADDWEIVE